MCDASELQRGETRGFYCNLSSALHDNDLRKQHCAISLSPEHLSDTLAMEQPEKHGKKKWNSLWNKAASALQGERTVFSTCEGTG